MIGPIKTIILATLLSGCYTKFSMNECVLYKNRNDEKVELYKIMKATKDGYMLVKRNGNFAIIRFVGPIEEHKMKKVTCPESI